MILKWEWGGRELRSWEPWRRLTCSLQWDGEAWGLLLTLSVAHYAAWDRASVCEGNSGENSNYFLGARWRPRYLYIRREGEKQYLPPTYPSEVTSGWRGIWIVLSRQLLICRVFAWLRSLKQGQWCSLSFEFLISSFPIQAKWQRSLRRSERPFFLVQ